MQTPLLPDISAEVLDGLAHALRAGRLGWPASAISLKNNMGSASNGLFEGLKALAEQFPGAMQAAAVLSMVAAERGAAAAQARRRVELVWSGPEGKAQSRDTAIVISELFTKAQRKVLMSTYNVGWKRGLFGPLVEKMQRNASFELTMFVHINWELTKDYIKSGEEPVAAFRRWFVETHWGDVRLPDVYYDPRALLEKHSPKLHAKCVIVDDAVALVTSANFSEAAQNDNIEAGVRVDDAHFATALAQQFEGLVATKKLDPVF